MRNRKNWKLTSIVNFRNILVLMTKLAVDEYTSHRFFHTDCDNCFLDYLRTITYDTDTDTDTDTDNDSDYIGFLIK